MAQINVGEVGLDIVVTGVKSDAIADDLLCPNPSDRKFRQPQTIFLAWGHDLTEDPVGLYKVPGAKYVYNDRVNALIKRARKQILTNAKPVTAEHIETQLREALNDPELNLVHIITGVYAGDGSSFRVYGYIPSGKSKIGDDFASQDGG